MSTLNIEHDLGITSQVFRAMPIRRQLEEVIRIGIAQATGVQCANQHDAVKGRIYAALQFMAFVMSRRQIQAMADVTANDFADAFAAWSEADAASNFSTRMTRDLAWLFDLLINHDVTPYGTVPQQGGLHGH